MQLGVKSWRRAKEISQSEMADKLGVHVGTYQNWEKNPQNISIENAVKIADIFGVSIDDISFTAQED